MSTSSKPAAASEQAVSRAVAEVSALVERSPSAADREYFAYHTARLRHTPRRLLELLPPGGRVLDVGSHFLHTTAMVRALGYDVQGIDVPAFAEMPHVAERARALGIVNRSVTLDQFAEDDAVAAAIGPVDAVLFCEILEHITFNPIRFWRRVHQVLRVGGFVYLTTPNAFRLLALLDAAAGLAAGRRVGLKVPRIFSHVTYGHHWKEYSASEIVHYFAALSPDFDVRVRRTTIPGMRPFPLDGVTGKLKEALRRAGNATGIFADQLEAVVTLRARTEWTTRAPTYD